MTSARRARILWGTLACDHQADESPTLPGCAPTRHRLLKCLLSASIAASPESSGGVSGGGGSLPIGDVALVDRDRIIGSGDRTLSGFFDALDWGFLETLQTVVDQDLKRQRTDLQLVSRPNGPLMFDRFAVDERAVLTVQISYDDLPVVHKNRTVSSTDGIASRP